MCIESPCSCRKVDTALYDYDLSWYVAIHFKYFPRAACVEQLLPSCSAAHDLVILPAWEEEFEVCGICNKAIDCIYKSLSSTLFLRVFVGLHRKQREHITQGYVGRWIFQVKCHRNMSLPKVPCSPLYNSFASPLLDQSWYLIREEHHHLLWGSEVRDLTPRCWVPGYL